MTTALLLSGAGARGLIQAGLLSAVIDSGINIDRVYGASVGALHGALYQQGVDRKGLEEIWLGIRNRDVYKTGPGSIFRALSDKACFHDSSPLLSLLNRTIAWEGIKANPRPFKIATTNLTNHQPVIRAASEFNSKEAFVQYLFASASPPVFFPPVEIDGAQYSDGGVSSNFNIAEAVRDGADTLIILRPQPLYKINRPKHVFEAIGLTIGIATERYLERELGFVERLNQINDEAYRDVKVVLMLCPNFGIDLLDFDMKHLDDRKFVMDFAYNLAQEELEKAFG